MEYKRRLAFIKFPLYFLLFILLYSCGGSGAESNGTGDINLDKNKINMFMEQLSSNPSDQIVISTSAPDVTYYSFSYIGEEPNWLTVYYGSENDIILEAHDNELPEGEYNTTLRIDISNQEGDIIGTQDVPVSLNVVIQFEIIAVPDSLTFEASQNTNLLSQRITFTSNTGSFPDIWSTTNTVTEWLTTTNSPEYDFVEVSIIPQPAGTYTHELKLLYYFNGSARWVYVPVTYISLE